MVLFIFGLGTTNYSSLVKDFFLSHMIELPIEIMVSYLAHSIRRGLIYVANMPCYAMLTICRSLLLLNFHV